MNLTHNDHGPEIGCHQALMTQILAARPLNPRLFRKDGLPRRSIAELPSCLGMTALCLGHALDLRAKQAADLTVTAVHGHECQCPSTEVGFRMMRRMADLPEEERPKSDEEMFAMYDAMYEEFTERDDDDGEAE